MPAIKGGTIIIIADKENLLIQSRDLQGMSTSSSTHPTSILHAYKPTLNARHSWRVSLVNKHTERLKIGDHSRYKMAEGTFIDLRTCNINLWMACLSLPLMTRERTEHTHPVLGSVVDDDDAPVGKSLARWLMGGCSSPQASLAPS